MSFSFPKSLRLLKSGSFVRACQKGKRRFGSFLSVCIKNNDTDKTLLGITVSRKFGKSHERNRFKRLVREAFRLTYSQLPRGIDLVVFPIKGSDPSLQDLCKELETLTKIS